MGLELLSMCYTYHLHCHIYPICKSQCFRIFRSATFYASQIKCHIEKKFESQRRLRKLKFLSRFWCVRVFFHLSSFLIQMVQTETIYYLEKKKSCDKTKHERKKTNCVWGRDWMVDPSMRLANTDEGSQKKNKAFTFCLEMIWVAERLASIKGEKEKFITFNAHLKTIRRDHWKISG